MANGTVKKSYEIRGKKYVQDRIVLGQLDLLVPILTGIEINPGFDSEAISMIIKALGGKLPAALAVVLVEEGADLSEAMSAEALAARTKGLAWAVDLELAVEVITDFFDVNPISSIGEKIKGSLGGVLEKFGRTNSKTSSTSLAAETSQAGSASFGESPPERPSGGSE